MSEIHKYTKFIANISKACVIYDDKKNLRGIIPCSTS